MLFIFDFITAHLLTKEIVGLLRHANIFPFLYQEGVDLFLSYIMMIDHLDLSFYQHNMQRLPIIYTL